MSAARTIISRTLALSRTAALPARPLLATRPPVTPASSRSMFSTLRWSSSTSASSTSSASSSSSEASSSAPSTSPSSPETPALEAPQPGSKPQPIGKVEPRLQITFTCTAGAEKGNPTCGHRSSHEFAKRSYEKGIVIIQCPECKARHLIADHIGWFKEVTEDGKLRTIEDLMKAKGEEVKKGRVKMDGDIEYSP